MMIILAYDAEETKKKKGKGSHNVSKLTCPDAFNQWLGPYNLDLVNSPRMVSFTCVC